MPKKPLQQNEGIRRLERRTSMKLLRNTKPKINEDEHFENINKSNLNAKRP
jgi:hypothetical protein